MRCMHKKAKIIGRSNDHSTINVYWCPECGAIKLANKFKVSSIRWQKPRNKDLPKKPSKHEILLKEIKLLVANGQFISAIKLVRETTGAGLYDSKTFCDLIKYPIAKDEVLDNILLKKLKELGVYI